MEKMRESGIFHLFLRLLCFRSDRLLTATDYLGPAQTRRQPQWGQENEQFGGMQSAGLTGRSGIAVLAYRAEGWERAYRRGSRSDVERRREIAFPHVSPFSFRGNAAAPDEIGAMDDIAGRAAKGRSMSGQVLQDSQSKALLIGMVAIATRELMRRFGRMRRAHLHYGDGRNPAAIGSRTEEEPAPPNRTPCRIHIRRLGSFDELACMEAWERSANDP